MDKDTARVVFTPSGKQGRFPLGTSVLDAARTLGVDLDSVCGGRGLCGRCQVEIGEGTFAKHGLASSAVHVSASAEVEARFDQRKGLDAKRRLGCQACLTGDAVIDIPPESQVHKQVVRKRAETRDIELDPAIRLYYLEVAEPDMHLPMGDVQRLKRSLADQWGLFGVSIDVGCLPVLQKTLRDGGWKVTVAVDDHQKLIALWPDLKARVFGLAIDVGSTTIAAHLADLATGEVVASAGMMNPQIRFGDDLMSRVSYVMMNDGGSDDLTAAVKEAIDQLIREVAIEAAIDAQDILTMTVVGNPVMHHLLLGISPVELGGAPFALATDEAISLSAGELGLTVPRRQAQVHILPCIAGHVGADAAAVALAEAPHLSDEMTLIVDVGTNAEILLGNKDRLLAASSPTGPAFEGAQISAGQRAAPGAIERVRINRETLEPRFKVIGSDLWSDEPGFEASIRTIGVTGICGSGIIEAIAELFLAGVLRHDGKILGDKINDSQIDGGKIPARNRIEVDGRTFAYRLHDGEPSIRITQNDIRAIQLAKAALYAGARLLMDHMGVERVERITLAGAFGSHIDVTYAMALGLIPDCDLDKVKSAGNAAGTGARIALLNRKARGEIESLAKRIEKVETAVEPRFQEHFIAAMAIPHGSAPYPSLAAAIDLPIRPLSAMEPSLNVGRERRRRRA